MTKKCRALPQGIIPVHPWAPAACFVTRRCAILLEAGAGGNTCKDIAALRTAALGDAVPAGTIRGASEDGAVGATTTHLLRNARFARDELARREVEPATGKWSGRRDGGEEGDDGEKLHVCG